jgi:hypothetical protein
LHNLNNRACLNAYVCNALVACDLLGFVYALAAPGTVCCAVAFYALEVRT